MAASQVLPLAQNTTIQTTSSTGAGTEYGLPAKAIQYTWQVVAASAVTVLIQASLDGVNWYTEATLSAAAGGGGTVSSSSKFIRSNVTVNGSLVATSVIINPREAGSLLPGYQGANVLIAASGVAVTAPLDTAENILATITIPAGLMGINGALRIQCVWTFTGSTNSKTLRIRFGGIGGTTHFSTAQTTAANVSYMALVLLHNRGSQSSQASQGGQFGASTAAVATGAIDTSAATTIVITGQKATGAEAIVLERYSVELLKAA